MAKLKIQRFRLQRLDQYGRSFGKPEFGVVATDENGAVYSPTFPSFKELKAGIQKAGSPLKLVDPDGSIFRQEDKSRPQTVVPNGGTALDDSALEE